MSVTNRGFWPNGSITYFPILKVTCCFTVTRWLFSTNTYFLWYKSETLLPTFYFSFNGKLKEANILYYCNKYSTGTENTENEKSYTCREDVFETLTISRNAFQSLVTTFPMHIANEEIKMAFKRKKSTPNLCNDYKGGGLNNNDISNKIISRQCSWIRWLYDNSFHEWKLIPFYLIKKSYGSSFKFHSDLFFKWNKIKCFPPFYRKICCTGKSILPGILKFPLAFCLSTYGTMKIFT